MNLYRNLLVKAGCVLEGEYFFALKGKRVSKKYINIDPIFTNPRQVMEIGRGLVGPFYGKFNCIVAPAVGGIPFLYSTAFGNIGGPAGPDADRLTTAFAEKVGDGFRFERMGFATAVSGRQVLIVEDISASGGTTKKVAERVRAVGGDPIGVSLIWNRGHVTPKMAGVPLLHALVTESMQTWEVSDNPPGWGTLPLVSDVGHPEHFKKYPGGYVKLLS